MPLLPKLTEAKLGHVGAMTKQQQAVYALAKLMARVYDCLKSWRKGHQPVFGFGDCN